jgi:cytoskeletal protein CcmA (bactofilin family)
MNGAAGWVRRELGSRGSLPASGAPAGAAAAEADGFAMVVVPGCQLEGTLEVAGSIRVEGEFRGALVSDGTVLVCEAAAVEAQIRARTVVIRGAVVGEVRASRELLLHASGRLKGAVETPSFVIERGAVFNGETRMFRPEQDARAR